jgi:hypothetical protein
MTSEADLDAYLTAVRCEYLAQPNDNGYRGWLELMAARIRNELKEQ